MTLEGESHKLIFLYNKTKFSFLENFKTKLKEDFEGFIYIYLFFKFTYFCFTQKKKKITYFC